PPAVLVARAVRDIVLGARIEDRGGVVDGRIDETVIGRRIAARRDDAGFLARRPRPLAVGFVVHCAVSRLSVITLSSRLRRQPLALHALSFRDAGGNHARWKSEFRRHSRKAWS